MRIISGKYRGKRLISPIGDDTRPTTDRIKESLFNILQFEIADTCVLDLFAGSGALGIEAISRGAKHVIFIDKSKECVGLIKKNLEKIEYNGSVICGNAINILSKTNEKFDIIFLDPPYNTDLGEQAINTIFGHELLNKNGKIVFEHGKRLNYTLPENAKLNDSRTYGKTTFIDFIGYKK